MGLQVIAELLEAVGQEPGAVALGAQFTDAFDHVVVHVEHAAQQPLVLVAPQA